ncbi:hypothetical protein QR680_005548 [Steinernema hermaphroditum]|uniref:RING finger protein 207 n=1 Tax=Steinernema hermaphroditum TaxID=289476 RepID=A0AA39HUN4_9BILA|nr:hypothetical protein QR680_005548 [Steinernema hermaphroditum]
MEGDDVKMEGSPEWHFSGNPLDCLICKREMHEPVRLSCHHSFCRRCVTADCPLCKTPVDCPRAELKPDSILSFLIDSSHETADICANCDNVSQPMHFCETCQQPLCNSCKLKTHQAKMFASHRIVLLEERGRVRGKMICAKHNEPFILYSLDSRMLVCIECFNSVALDSRHNLVNIDSAHKMNCEKLEKSALKLRSVQDDLCEHIEVRRRFIREIEANCRALVDEIRSTCKELTDKLISVQNLLIAKVEKEQRAREKMLMSDLNSLLISQVPIRLYLLCCSIFCSSASKIDFLHWYGELSRRIQALSSTEFDKIHCSADFPTFNCRAEFARSLESILGWSSLLLNSTTAQSGETPKSSSGTVSPRTSSSGYAKRRTDLAFANSALSKYQLIVDFAGAFGELFARVDGPLKQLILDMSDVSKAVQEAQKDLTLRRQLIDADTVKELIVKSECLEAKLTAINETIAEVQPQLQELWQEQLDRIRRQQLLFREKMEEHNALLQTASRVTQAARRLQPFAHCLSSVVSVIDPRRCHPPDPAPMERICMEISTIKLDHNNRLLAIEKEEETRRLAREQKRAREEEGFYTCTKGSLKAKSKDATKRLTAASPTPSTPSVVIVSTSRDRGSEKCTRRHHNSSSFSGKQTRNMKVVSTETESLIPFDLEIAENFVTGSKSDSVTGLARSVSLDMHFQKSEEEDDALSTHSELITSDRCSLFVRKIETMGICTFDEEAALAKSGPVTNSGPRKNKIPDAPFVPKLLETEKHHDHVGARERLMASLKKELMKVNTVDVNDEHRAGDI